MLLCLVALLALYGCVQAMILCSVFLDVALYGIPAAARPFLPHFPPALSSRPVACAMLSNVAQQIHYTSWYLTAMYIDDIVISNTLHLCPARRSLQLLSRVVAYLHALLPAPPPAPPAPASPAQPVQGPLCGLAAFSSPRPVHGPRPALALWPHTSHSPAGRP